MQCCGQDLYEHDEDADGVCPDCGQPTINGLAIEMCSWSPCECSTCGWSPCDGSC